MEALSLSDVTDDPGELRIEEYLERISDQRVGEPIKPRDKPDFRSARQDVQCEKRKKFLRLRAEGFEGFRNLDDSEINDLAYREACKDIQKAIATWNEGLRDRSRRI